MSNQLAASIALSVLMMASYALFGAESVRAPLDGAPTGQSARVQAAALPAPETGLPGLR